MRRRNKLRPRDVLITDKGNFIYCGSGYVLNLDNGKLISIDTYWDKQLQYRMKFREYCQPDNVYIIENFVKFEEYFAITEKGYEHKKERFTVKCNSCGSDNVSIQEEFDYDYDENIVGTGNYYLRCNDCGETNEDY